VVTAVGWTLVAVSVTGLAVLFGWLAKARYTPLPSLSSRGEEARMSQERNDEMAVARSVGVEPSAADWDLWEEQFYSLTPLVDRVARIREGRR
jgi:hypothetical protein